MKMKFTAKSVAALKPYTKRCDIWDTSTPGLHIRLSPNGRKTWYVSTKNNRDKKRIKIGPYPLLSLKDARKVSQNILRDIVLGRFKDDAHAEPTQTFAEVVHDFMELYAKKRQKDWRGRKSLLRKFEALNNLKINEIKRPDVVAILDELVTAGIPIRANRALAAIKKLFSWCVERGVLEYNPISGLRSPMPETPRDRVLSDNELSNIWHAASVEGYPFGPCIQLLILTAQRRGEVSGMRWSEISFADEVWTIPRERTKNSTLNVVPLTPFCQDILHSLPTFLGSDFVFTTNGMTPISGFGRLKSRLDITLGIADWRLHDIRRTVATGMAKQGVQPHIIEAILNHKSGIVSGVAAVYNRHAYFAEKRESILKWENYLMDMSLTRRIFSRTTCHGKGHG